ncbi:MAG: hypothetical protein R2845_03605 [Thermomicrobiales bacterium]
MLEVVDRADQAGAHSGCPRPLIREARSRARHAGASQHDDVANWEDALPMLARAIRDEDSRRS